MRITLPVLLAAAFAAGPVAAQVTSTAPAPTQPDAPVDDDPTRITIGVGAATVPIYEGADENQIIPAAVAVGRIRGYDFFTRGTQLYVDLARDRPGPGTNLELGPIAAVRLDRTNRVDQPNVRALGRIDTAYELGAFVGVSRTGVITSDFDTLSARVAYLADVGGAHGSYVITPQVTYTTPLSLRTLVSIGASADYVGRGYGRTYFGITPAQSLASGLRTFDAADSGWKRYNLSAFALQSLSGDLRRGFGVGAGVIYGRMLGRYKDSPIVSDVGDADQWAAAVGLTYTF